MKYTFLIMSDAIGEQLSKLRFDTIQEAANAACDYMVTATENGDFVMVQVIDVFQHCSTDEAIEADFLAERERERMEEFAFDDLDTILAEECGIAA